MRVEKCKRKSLRCFSQQATSSAAPSFVVPSVICLFSSFCSTSICCCFVLNFLFHTDVLFPLWRCIYFIALWYAMLLKQKSINVNVTCTVSVVFFCSVIFSCNTALLWWRTHTRTHTLTYAHTHHNMPVTLGNVDALQSSCHKTIFLKMNCQTM